MLQKLTKLPKKQKINQRLLDDMKMPIILLCFILILCFFIGRLEPNDEVVVKNINSIGKAENGVWIKRMLWIMLIVLQSLLCFSLFKSSKMYNGGYRIAILTSIAVALLFLISFVYIFIISLNSVWI